MLWSSCVELFLDIAETFPKILGDLISFLATDIPVLGCTVFDAAFGSGLCFYLAWRLVAFIVPA